MHPRFVPADRRGFVSPNNGTNKILLFQQGFEAFAKQAFSLNIRKILVENTRVFGRRAAKDADFADASASYRG